MRHQLTLTRGGVGLIEKVGAGTHRIDFPLGVIHISAHGGLIGASVDAGTGAMLDLTPNPVNVRWSRWCRRRPRSAAACR